MDLAAQLRTLVENRRAVLVSGPPGIGKTHALRTVGEALSVRGWRAPVLSGRALAAGVPLGVFAGTESASDSVAAVVDAFARRRSTSVLLVDDIHLADSASHAVIAHLVRTTGVPAVCAAESVVDLPEPLRDLYDAGDLVDIAVPPLDDRRAQHLAEELLEGSLTPSAAARLVSAADGNPLHLRELVRGTMQAGSFEQGPHGWELRDPLALTPRLEQILGAELDALPTETLDALATVVIAGALPLDAFEPAIRRELLRLPLLEEGAPNWIAVAHPLAEITLERRYTPLLWRALVEETVGMLRGPLAVSDPNARRRAALLCLDHDLPLSPADGADLAERSLRIGDHRLALRAATAVLESDHTAVSALRVAGISASMLGLTREADDHLDRAAAHAANDEDRTAVAVARAQHLGVRHRDAHAAVATVQQARAGVVDLGCSALLEASIVRWSAVAGQVTAAIEAPAEATTAADALLVVTAGMAGVIAGPVQETAALLPAMKGIPESILTLVPGGHTLVRLAESMALSYSGDAVATRHYLDEMIDEARSSAPEELGTWEYTRGFLNLLTVGADSALEDAAAAVDHLSWRDPTGLLGAALALRGAALVALDRHDEGHEAFASVPTTAQEDPKYLMLRGWGDAWVAHRAGHGGRATRTLLATAERLLDTHHTFMAGMIAHCAVRLGRDSTTAATIIAAAETRGGGGLLRLLARHAVAMQSRDAAALEVIAHEAEELGLVSTAADTWRWLAERTTRGLVSEIAARRYGHRADELTQSLPQMPVWTDRPASAETLTPGERAVAHLAAERLSAREIAERRGVSTNTVTNQLNAVYRKLGVRGRVELRELLRPPGSTALPSANDAVARARAADLP